MIQLTVKYKDGSISNMRGDAEFIAIGLNSLDMSKVIEYTVKLMED